MNEYVIHRLAEIHIQELRREAELDHLAAKARLDRRQARARLKQVSWLPWRKRLRAWATIG